MRTLAAWGAIVTALAAGYALEVVALRVRQGTDLAAAASAMLLAAAVGALANRLRARRVANTDVTADRPVPALSGVGTLARLGHELRAPLHAIMSHTDALANEVATEAQRATLAAIRRNSDHLLEVMVRALGGPQMPVQVACRPATLVADVVTMVRRIATQKSLELRIDCVAPIPESVLADATALRQVLLNLIDNAVKFTARGSVTLVVDFADTPRTELRFAVRDTGSGIRAAELESIFEPHRRGAAAHTAPGAGLGLAIARELVHTMGGRLVAESRPGAGSTFTLTVPVHVDPTTPRCAIDVDPPSTIDHAGGPRLHGRVLLVEDASDVRELLARTLERAGAEVDAVGTGSEGLGRALAAAHVQHPFDLVLMDLQLPGLDGDEVVWRLRRAGCDAPIVALTAAAGADVRARCLAAGCTDYLAKPVGLDVLLAVTEHHLSNGGTVTPLTSSLPRDAGLEEVVASFVGLLEGRMRELQQAADSGDATTVERLAHRLRGAAGSHGFAPISDAALALEETAAAGGNLTPALVLLARLCRRATVAHRRTDDARSVVEEREILPVAFGLETLLRDES